LIVGLGLAVTLVLLGASLAASPAPVPVIASPGTAAAPRPISVIMRDFKFDPTPLYLIPGETVRISVFNGGLVEHELVLGDDHVQGAWALADAQATAPAPLSTAPPASVTPGTGGLRLLLGSGASTTVDYLVPATGEVSVYCHLPGHAERGMVGEVTLVSR
jgi:uncharacterized cupredoxin-like copper-binding protein